jgi:hypothetical protein
MSIENCWVKCAGKVVTDATDNEATEVVIPERDMTIASGVLETSLRKSDFEDWINANQNLHVVNLLLMKKSLLLREKLTNA